jgi:hypothetical protein
MKGGEEMSGSGFYGGYGTLFLLLVIIIIFFAAGTGFKF